MKLGCRVALSHSSEQCPLDGDPVLNNSNVVFSILTALCSRLFGDWVGLRSQHVIVSLALVHLVELAQHRTKAVAVVGSDTRWCGRISAR